MCSTALSYAIFPLAFFIGAIPFGFLAGKRRGIDLREHGSKSIGATNTLRLLGPAAGGAVLALDTAKGLLPILLARTQHFGGAGVVATGLCAVLGHIYSPFVRFKGGKGVATSLGVLIALSPSVAACSIVVFLVTVYLTRWVSLGSILAAIAQSVLFFLLEPNERAFQWFGLIAAGFVIYRHRANIARLCAGTEPRVTFRRKLTSDG